MVSFGSWSSRPQTAAPGDWDARTITLSADDVSGMTFPPMQHSEIEGASLYPGQTDGGPLSGPTQFIWTDATSIESSVVFELINLEFENRLRRRSFRDSVRLRNGANQATIQPVLISPA